MGLGDAIENRAGLGESAGRKRKPRNEADAVRLAIVEHVLAAAIDEVVAILHRRHLEHLRGVVDVGDRNLAQAGMRMMPSSSSDLTAPNCSSRGTLGSMRCSCQRPICSTPSCLQLLSASFSMPRYGWSVSRMSCSDTSGP